VSRPAGAASAEAGIGMAENFKVPPPPQMGRATGFTLALPLTALLVQDALRAWIEPIPFVLFFFTVGVVSWLAGWKPALLSVVVSAALGFWFLRESASAVRVSGARVGALVFMPVAAACAALGSLAREGMRERKRARIFERFERERDARGYAGFGLGLWSVRELVSAHGGSVTLQRAPGEGSTFAVHLLVAGPPSSLSGAHA
jgi:K+-sensing histidine kinase KdpD